MQYKIQQINNMFRDEFRVYIRSIFMPIWSDLYISGDKIARKLNEIDVKHNDEFHVTYTTVENAKTSIKRYVELKERLRAYKKKVKNSVRFKEGGNVKTLWFIESL